MADLLSYGFVPIGYIETNVSSSNWRNLDGQYPSFDELSIMVFADAIDSIATVWRNYIEWRK